MSYVYDYAIANNADRPHVEVYIANSDGTDHETVCIIPMRESEDDSVELAKLFIQALKRR